MRRRPIPGLRAIVRKLGDVAPADGVFSRLARVVQRHPALILMTVAAALFVCSLPVLRMHPTLSGTALLPDSLKKLAALNPAELPLASGDLRIGPCVGKIGKFVCIGLNYADHAAETGASINAMPLRCSSSRPHSRRSSSAHAP